jgi:hypothetical protein
MVRQIFSHPCTPISNYSASHFTEESYLPSFSGIYEIKDTSVHLANIYGERITNGVTQDFYPSSNETPKSSKFWAQESRRKSMTYSMQGAGKNALSQSAAGQET